MQAVTRLLTAFAVLALLPAALAGATEAPRSVKVTYEVSLNGLTVARMTERFEANGGRYRAESESAPVGIFKLFQPRPAHFLSRGRVTPDGLAPERFEGARGAEDKRRVSAAFDWREGRVTLEHDGTTESFALPAGAQDRLSMMYQFMLLRYDGKDEIEFAMTNGRKIDRYRYLITRAVEIDTALGRVATLHLVKQREPGDTVTEIWVAPEYRHLPVKMLVIDDGSRYEQVVTGIEIDP